MVKEKELTIMDHTDLIGKKIVSIAICDECCLRFSTDREPVFFVADGECCDTSWWNDVLGVANLLNATVKDVQGSVTLQGQHEALIGFKILTEKGFTDLVFRNNGGESGCYTGELTVEGQPRDGFKRWEEITQDWSCDDPAKYDIESR